MGNDLDEFNEDNEEVVKITSTVKPASEAWGEVKAKTAINYTIECMVCDKEYGDTKKGPGICSNCKDELNLLIKNR